ncbi:MAG: hypothetical protein ABR548_10410 [Actinomycetota bacterium]|nr:hypothetical protein [Actinomycetota bacterium]
MSIDLAGTGGVPLGAHRMLNPLVRVRVLVVVAVLITAMWASIAALGGPDCAAFTQGETRELAGLPVPPACITDRFAPTNPIDQLGNSIDKNQPFPGVAP